MIQRLMEQYFFETARLEPRWDFLLRELRTPELLVECKRQANCTIDRR
jgi:hypothetical protein